MNPEIIASRNFRKEAKRLLKKYSSLKGELEDLYKQLLQNPTLGTSLGHDCYKIRLAILLSIYDKSEFESISDKDLRRLLHELNNL